MSIVGIFLIDKEHCLMYGFSLGNFLKPYSCLPYSTKYYGYQFNPINYDSYRLYIPSKDSVVLKTRYIMVDDSGKEDFLVPKEILKYAYSKTDLFIQVEDTASSVFWITPKYVGGKSTYTIDRTYNNLVVREADIDFSNLKLIDFNSWMCAMVGWAYLVFCSILVFFIPVPFIYLYYVIKDCWAKNHP